MLDILIRHGEVVDGSGSPRYRADVALEGERIVEIGQLENATARVVLDAAGCIVCPGFVDMHSHADGTLPLRPTADSLVHQGITTAVIGQCGSSPAPLLPETRAQVLAMMEDTENPLPWEQWSTFGSYLDYLRRIGLSLNAVPLVGQGTIRGAVLGFAADPPSAEQLARMQALVIASLEEGAIGLSTGLIYPPGFYSSTEELIALTRPVGERKGYYFSHIRGEGATLLAAVAEAIRIGRETGAAVQISHFKASGSENWAASAQALELIDRARAEGLDVSADMYPYLAGSTGLLATLPQWATEGGKEAILARLRDEDTRAKMSAAMHISGYARALDWSLVLISSCPRSRAWEGRTASALADEAGKAPHVWVFDALLAADLEVGMIVFHSSEENRRRELRHPAMMIGTDGAGLGLEGPFSTGKPHPRNFGAYPYILQRYVRDEGLLSLEEAVWKMSGLPAYKLRWSNRGLIRKGYQADLVVLNPRTVADRATYENPQRYPAGIQHVLVNGALVIQEGAHTGARPGAVLG